MRKLVIGLAMLAGLGLALPVTTAANAETVKKVIIKKRGHDMDRGHTQKVIIKHGDRGNHYGWRNRHRERDSNVGFTSRRGGDKVIIKKRVDSY